ncbi:MAG: hypothetical protein ABR961_05760 [Thermoanaerobaculaceae bacterium]
MPSGDPVGDLVMLARGAADAGENWRSRLRREWLPRTVESMPRSLLDAALAEWLDEAPAETSEIAGRLEAVVLAAMAEQGYD